MYSRKLNGKVLEFGHEGVLYRNSFVMYDRKSDSLWVHTTGECVKGEMKGSQLKFIPSTITSWEQWKTKHPKTLVLPGKGVGGFMGTYSLKADSAEKFGVSVGQGDDAKLYLVNDLMKHSVIHDKFMGKNVAVFFNANDLHGTAWDCGNNKFKSRLGKFVDQRGRAWDMMLGRPVDAKNDSEKMTPLPATMWLVNRWNGFYPKSTTWTEAKKL